MNLIDMRSVTVTEKGQIAIPRQIREMEGFEVGSKIAILAFKDKIELRPLKQISKAMLTAFASEKSLAKDWNSKDEEEAWKNL